MDLAEKLTDEKKKAGELQERGPLGWWAMDERRDAEAKDIVELQRIEIYRGSSIHEYRVFCASRAADMHLPNYVCTALERHLVLV